MLLMPTIDIMPVAYSGLDAVNAGALVHVETWTLDLRMQSELISLNLADGC